MYLFDGTIKFSHVIKRHNLDIAQSLCRLANIS